MKNIIRISFSLLLSVTTYAQNYQSIEEINDACAQLGFMGDEDAEIAVDRILSQVGLFSNFTIQECPEINNAVAKMIDMGSGRKERYILYDNAFFNRISNKAANDWAAISILAHEIGHHLNGHALNNEGSNHRWELEADEFSGFVLARMGSTLEDAQSAIKTLRLERATRTHPAKADRLIAIEKGWNRGKGNKIVVPEIKKDVPNTTEDIKEDVAVVTNNESVITNYGEVDAKKLQAQKILNTHINAIGGEENVIKVKTLYQKVKMTTTTTMNGTDNSSESHMELLYLSPNRYITEMEMSGTPYYTLNLEGKTYTKSNKNADWTYQSFNDLMKNQASYVYEYSMLVNNEDVSYLGEDTYNGVACHVVQLQDYNTNQKHDAFTLDMKIQRFNYYDKNTGLLLVTKSKIHQITDYKNNNEYLKDTDSKYETSMVYTNYKPFNGVLFPSKMTMIMNNDQLESKTVMEYVDIKVNPEVNKSDFRVKE